MRSGSHLFVAPTKCLTLGKRFCLLAAIIAVVFFIAPATTSAHITSLIPSSIVAGSSDFTLRILGFDFDASDTGRVLFDGTRVATTLVSSEELRATIPANLITRPGIVTVALEGFNSVEFIIDPPGSCLYSITIGAGRSQLIGQIFPADGGTGTANIEVLAGCRWVANLTDTDSFTSFTSVHGGGGELVSPFVATGSGAATLTYSVRPNVRPDPRSAIIRLFRSDFATPLPAEPFTVTQEGSRCPASAYQISPLDTAREDDGGAGTIHVTAPPGCRWTAIPDQRWIEVSPLGGTGSRDISYNVASNDGLWRSGNVVIAGKTFSVIQLPTDCVLRVVCAYLPETCQGAAASTLTTARHFRDGVLSKSVRGQRYTRLYYSFSREALGTLMLNPMLILSSQQALQRYKPVLESMIKGERITLTNGDIEEIEGLLNSFAQKGSPELREALKGLIQDLRDPRVQQEFNITMSDGPKRELPAQGAIGGINRMNGLTVLFGSALGGLVISALGRRKRRRAFFCIALALLLAMVGLPSPSAQASGWPDPNRPIAPATGVFGKQIRMPVQLASSQRLAYSTYFGGSRNEEGNSIAVDPAGNVYVAGFTDSSSFPLVNASQPNFGGGQQDAFVAKLDPSGTRLIYSTYVGGNGQDNATAIVVDAAGNAYITGFTDSTNFPVKNGFQETNRGDFNAFVVKLDATGTLLNSTLFGGSASDYGSSIAVDAAGNIYTAGIASSPDLPMINALQSTHSGLVDMFVAKFDPSGSRLIYSTYLGGVGIEGASSIAVDNAGNLYLTGLTSSPNLRIVNALQSAHGGGLFDAFVAKLNSSGSEVIYSTYLGGGGEDRGLRIAVDSSGSAYITGDTDSTNYPLANPAQQTKGGSSDAFVSKLNPSGTQLVYSTYLGGSGIDSGAAIAVDRAGTAYLTGFTASTDFPSAGSLQQVFGGSYDGFISRLSSSGAALDFSTYFGGSGIDSGFGITTDATGNAYVMGVTESMNFPVANALQPANRGGTADLFIAKISSGPSITGAMVDKKRLLVFGSGFDNGAKILVNGESQKTSNDEQNPTGALMGKKAGKKIERGQTVTLQVRNSDGTLSNEFRFARP